MILNPHAGRGYAGQQRPELEAALRRAQLPFDLVTTHARGGATELAWQAIERGVGTIVAAGGDGTINEVVNGIVGAERSSGRRARLGIVPVGTGSDFIKSLGGLEPNDIPGAVERIAHGHLRPVDIGRTVVDDLEPRYYINAFGMGLDAQVAAEALQLSRLRGFAVYLVAVLRALVHYRANPMLLEYNERRVQRRLLFATVANGRCQGANFWLTPDAVIDDGLFDLCLVNNLRLDQIVRYIPRVMEGTHTTLKVVTMDRANQVRISSPAAVPVAVDGEVITTAARQVEIETIYNGVDVLA